MPQITVLMPVYNAEKFLKDAIESILNQTFIDFEFLIIDDGSTDSSPEIIRSYKDKRIRFTQNEMNLGITATLNKGIEMASCELIARMDSDDISYPQRLQKQYDYLQQHTDCALLSTWMRKFNDIDDRKKFIRHKPEHCYFTLVFNTWIHHPAVMYKRSAVKDVGMYTNQYSEDYNLWCKMSRKYKIHILPEVLLDYRETAQSLWKVSKKVEYEKAHCKQMMDNIRYYTGEDYKISETEIQFLRGYNLAVLLENTNKKFLVECFKKLEYIALRVEGVENVNKVSNQVIREAAFNKKKTLIYQLSQYLEKRTLISLLIKLRYWKLLVRNVAKMAIGI